MKRKVLRSLLGGFAIALVMILLISFIQAIGSNDFKTEFIDTVKDCIYFSIVLIISILSIILCAYIFNKTISKL